MRRRRSRRVLPDVGQKAVIPVAVDNGVDPPL